MNTITTWVLAAALLAGPAFADDKQAIQALDDQFSAAINRGDAAAVAAMYAPDANILPPGSGPIPQSGAQALFASFAPTASHFRLTADKVDRISPDYLREIGSWSYQTKAATPQDLKGSYVVVWKRVGGQWKLWTDIWH